jgi:hypothetical protein
MKKLLIKKTFGQTLLSMIILGVFITLAVGSLVPGDWGVDMEVRTTDTGNGIYKVEETHQYYQSRVRIITGRRDDKGRWHGPVTFEWKGGSREEVDMVNGRRHGISTTYEPDGRKIVRNYRDGICKDNKKAARRNGEGIASFQILSGKYPWFLSALNVFDFEDAYVEAYMDTLETVLNTFEFDIAEFDSYYEDALDILGETPYDSIIALQSNLFIVQGLEEMKNAELRLAVIDRYRSKANSTFDIVGLIYPGYLQMLNDTGVADADFEQFCQDLDDTLETYGSLDPEDSFFTDSVDARLFRALFALMSLDELSASQAKGTMKNEALAYGHFYAKGILGKFSSLTGLRSVKSSSSEVAAAVVSGMLTHFLRADNIRIAVKEAYMIKKGIVRVPITATEFLGNNSATSVTLQGYVMEDGGAAVTSRGIAWAVFYNPTTDNNTVSSGTGTGDFTVTLDGLTEGTAYYARTYATNTAGTAYGNCISFVAAIPSGIDDINLFIRPLKIYPNPASELTTFSFQLESSESIMLTVLDVKGQMVFSKDLGRLPQGDHQIEVNLSGLQDGMYNCQLTNGTTKVTHKLLIAH